MLARSEFQSLAYGFPIVAMPTIAQIRHANLLLLIGDGHGAVKRFAQRIDRDPSQVSQLKSRSKHSKSGDPREMGDDMARHIENMLKLTPGWLDTPQGVKTTGDSLPPESDDRLDMAQAMSESRNYSDPPRLQWGNLMGADLTQPFELEVIDDALSPEIYRGCIVRLDPKREPRPGQPVLVRDRDGQHHLRDYQRGVGNGWQAVARTRGFAPLDSAEHGLQLVATVKGVDWP